ncbi:uncharacterized protein PAN0_011d4185 [Moesziomyces antarcticus]|uniref:Uncharacterized protein n=2 Tax=Pseudozyma antarctica TaxID=84753 RepID=A0A081CH17_PSEA2|nr:uncharacterized protein PAN0_011d4185 [Moesziomyces antarcticus]GAK65963.1 conserved hypothetical protein [Moesziomyces antarcticus]SPO46737.1 uncharacterized protein PSANT_04423 [Moesziomyces antarcticus]
MAEKFSKFRDPGTGIQVFLTPVSTRTTILLPILTLLGIVRCVLALVAYAVYFIAPSVGVRLGLVALGYWRVSPDYRGKVVGRVVVANHSSWIDLLLLSALYPGAVFVQPVRNDAQRAKGKVNAVSANTRMTGVNDPNLAIIGYALLPLHHALHYVGDLPPTTLPKMFSDIDSAVKSVRRPVVVFPEVVTSNNRALLHFDSALVPNGDVVVVSIKYASPSPAAPSSVSAPFQPAWKHALKLLFTSPVRNVTVKATMGREDVGGVLAGLGRWKRTAIDWTAKREFLDLVQARTKKT